MKRYALFVLAFIAGGCAESNDAGMQLQQENVRSGGIMARGRSRARCPRPEIEVLRDPEQPVG